MYQTQLHTTLNDATTFTDVVRSVALSYIAQGYKEQTADNTDTFIQQLFQCYQGYVPTGKGTRAYCAVGAWVLMNTAYNIVEQSGKGQINRTVLNALKTKLGNVAQFESTAKQYGILSNTPEVGSLMIRSSDVTANGLHAGIVYAVNADGSIVVIEFNASSENANGGEGVGSRRYDANDIDNYKKFVFAHIHRNAVVSGSIFGSFRDNCMGFTIEIPPPNTATTTTPTEPCANYKTDSQCPPGWRLRTANERLTPPYVNPYRKGSTEANAYACCIPTTQPNTTVTNNTPPTGVTTNTPCTTNVVAVPCSSSSSNRPKLNIPTRMPLYSDVSLQQYMEWLVPDIEDMFDKTDKDALNAFSAIMRLSRNANKTAPMVCDRNGNVYIIATDATTSYQVLKQSGLIPNPIFIAQDIGEKVRDDLGMFDNYDIGAFVSASANSLLKTGRYPLYSAMGVKDNTANWGRAESDWRMENQFARYNNVSLSSIGLDNQIFGQNNLRGAIEAIERTGKKFNNTFVLYAIGKYSGKGVVSQVVDTVGKTAFTAGLNTVIPGLGTTVVSIAQKINSGASVTVGELSALAQMLLPSEYGKYIDNSARILTAVQKIPKGATSGQELIDVTKDIATLLNGNVMPQWIKQGDETVASIKLFANNQWAEANKYINGIKEDVAKTVQAYANTSLGVLGSQYAKGDRYQFLADEIDSIGGLFKHEQLNNLFLQVAGTNAGSQISTLPNPAKFVSKLLETETSNLLLVEPNDYLAILGGAGGFKVPDEAVLRLQMESLFHKAEDMARKGMEFAMPAVFEFSKDKDVKERADCIKREIEVCVGIKKTTTTTTTTTKTNNVTNTPVTTTPDKPNITLPPPTMVLPNCIKLISGKHYYCPESNCDSMLWKQLGITPPKLTPVGGSTFTVTDTLKPNNNSNTTVTAPTLPSNVSVTVPKNTVSVAPTTTLVNTFQPTLPTSPSKPSSVSVITPFSQAKLPSDGLTPPPITQSFAPPVSTLSPRLTLGDPDCTFLYEAVYDSANGGVWYALIGGKYIRIISCCPVVSIPTTTTTTPSQVQQPCCDDLRSSIATMTNQIARLQELVSRLSVGEQSPATDLSGIVAEIATIKTLINGLRNVATTDIKQVDLSPLQQQINELQTLVRNNSRSIVSASGYDDTSLKNQIAELRSLITQTKSVSERSYDDEIQLLVANMNNMREAFENNIRYLQQQVVTNNDSTAQAQMQELIAQRDAQLRKYESELQKAQQAKTTTTTQQPTQRLPETVIRPQQIQQTCFDCPAVVETHQRVVYRYPEYHQHVEQPCNDC